MNIFDLLLFILVIIIGMFLENYTLDAFKTTKTLMLLVGVPGSGKSAWIKSNKLESCTLSTDDIRLELAGIETYIKEDGTQGERIPQSLNEETFKLLYQRTQERLQDNQSTIIDATNLSAITLRELKAIATQHKAKFVLNVFDIPSIEVYQEVVKRDAEREAFRRVGEDVIKYFYQKLLKLKNKKFYSYNHFFTEIIPSKDIFDKANNQLNTTQKILQELEFCPLVKKRKLTATNKEGKTTNLASYNFTKDAFYNAHWDELTTTARGLFVYDDGREQPILARSYNKFFNFGELAQSREYKEELKQYKAPFKVYKKENGYLGIVAYNEDLDQLIYCSKSTNTHFFAENVEKHLKPYEKNILNYLKNEGKYKTLVFEIVDQEEDFHIIPYKDPHSVYLLDVIDNSIETFTKLNFDELQKVYLKLISGVESNYKLYIKKFCGEYQDLYPIVISLIDENIEGYVVEDANGKMFKFKGLKYTTVKQMRSILHMLQKFETFEELKDKISFVQLKNMILEGIDRSTQFQHNILEAFMEDKPTFFSFIDELSLMIIEMKVLFIHYFMQAYNTENIESIKSITVEELFEQIKDIKYTTI